MTTKKEIEIEIKNDGCLIKVDALSFIPRDAKKAIKWIKEARKSAIDKAIEKMEHSSFYQIFNFKLEDEVEN